jgi:hypothetical protein
VCQGRSAEFLGANAVFFSTMSSFVLWLDMDLDSCWTLARTTMGTKTGAGARVAQGAAILQWLQP